MSHALATSNGRPAMAYFGETPWHRLGTRLNEPATAAEAIAAAELNYDVELHQHQPLFVRKIRRIRFARASLESHGDTLLGLANTLKPKTTQ